MLNFCFCSPKSGAKLLEFSLITRNVWKKILLQRIWCRVQGFNSYIPVQSVSVTDATCKTICQIFWTIVGAWVIMQMYFSGQTELQSYSRQAASFVCHVLPNNPWSQVSYTPGESLCRLFSPHPKSRYLASPMLKLPPMINLVQAKCWRCEKVDIMHAFF